jgi:hypothetical protein
MESQPFEENAVIWQTVGELYPLILIVHEGSRQARSYIHSLFINLYKQRPASR